MSDSIGGAAVGGGSVRRSVEQVLLTKRARAIATALFAPVTCLRLPEAWCIDRRRSNSTLRSCHSARSPELAKRSLTGRDRPVLADRLRTHSFRPIEHGARA